MDRCGRGTSGPARPAGKEVRARCAHIWHSLFPDGGWPKQCDRCGEIKMVAPPPPEPMTTEQATLDG